MAYFQMNYHSDALKMAVSVNVILPEKAKTAIGIQQSAQTTYKTLYLYHGLSDDHSIWQRRTSIERYAAEAGIAVVMPSVARSFYTDTAYGMNYFTFVADELPAVCRSFFRGMSDKREDNMVAGLSMGGYGAVKVALSRPEQFGYCCSLSGALDICDIARGNMTSESRGIFGFSIEDISEIKNTKNDLFYLAKKLHEENKPFPKTYIWCGTKDFLLSENEHFSQFLTELGVPHDFILSEGDHSWKWWDLHIQDAIAFFKNK